MNRLLFLSVLVVGAVVFPRLVGNRVSFVGGAMVDARSRTDSRSRGQAEAVSEGGGADLGLPNRRPRQLNPYGPPPRAPQRLRGMWPGAWPLGWRIYVHLSRHNTVALGIVWTVFSLLFATALVTFVASLHGIARACCRIGLRIAAIELALLSCCAVFLYVAGIGFVPAVSSTLWLCPVGFVLVSAGLMRMVDLNYPFWNETVRALVIPIAASALVIGWDYVLPAARGARTSMFPGNA